jgi:hypothetical protein
MRKALAILAAAVWLVLPAQAAAGHDHHHCGGVHMSEQTSIDVDGDLLVITNRDWDDGGKIVISEDGELTIDGERVETDGKSRKLLKKFYREAVKLDEQAQLIAEDAEDLAEEATVFAAAAVRAALRSLADDQDEDAEADFADLEAGFEDQAELIEKLGDEIGDQADRLKELAEELRERIPELDAVEWFLDT